jgi:hypothetical protein
MLVLSSYLAFLDTLPDEMVADVDVLAALVVHQVPAERYCKFVVHLYGYRSWFFSSEIS